jgi:hypothetical protein
MTFLAGTATMTGSTGYFRNRCGNRGLRSLGRLRCWCGGDTVGRKHDYVEASIGGERSSIMVEQGPALGVVPRAKDVIVVGTGFSPMVGDKNDFVRSDAV